MTKSRLHCLTVSIITLLMFSSAATSSPSGGSRVYTDFKTLEATLSLFTLDVGRFPTSDEGLISLVSPSVVENVDPAGYLKKLPKDPWGNNYHYLYPGEHNSEEFDLWSNGADGLPGGEGLDSDIGNWPGGQDSFNQAWSAQQSRQKSLWILKRLPLMIGIGVLFSGSIYLGICLLRLSDGVEKKRAFTGKSMWIGLVIFIIYCFVTYPLVAA